MWRRFLTPRWLGFHALVATGAVVMVYLGFWQLDRLDARQAFNATVVARTEQAPRPLADVLNQAADGADVEWTPVYAEGRWLIDEQVLVINRSQGGVAGRNVVTPLETADGTVIAVTRGFIALTQQPPGVPTDTAQIRGLLRPSEQRGFGGVSDPATGRLAELQRLDLDRLAVQLPAEVADRLAPWSLTLEASDPPQPAPLVAAPRPELGEGPHLSYAVQWFVFALCVAIGWVFAMNRSIRSHRRSRPSPTHGDALASASPEDAVVPAETPPTSPA
jgi:cytochrome oxidase assembly protein ShyY1